MEDLCSILNSGEPPDLFDSEDKERIAMELRKDATASGVRDSKESIYQFFLSRVHPRLHLVLSTSPSGTLFRQRCRTYPALINCCTIDWFDEWPTEALLTVAETHLLPDELSKDEDRVKILHKSVSNAFVKIHKSIEDATTEFYQELRRHFHVTPRSYIEFIQLYRSLLRKKKSEHKFTMKRMKTGLSKLAESKEMVGVMKKELTNLGPVLEEKQKVCSLKLYQISDRCSSICCLKTRFWG